MRRSQETPDPAVYIGGPSDTNTRHILARTPRTRHQQHEHGHQNQHAYGGGGGSQSTANSVGRLQHPVVPSQHPPASRNSAFSRNPGFARNPPVWANYFPSSSNGDAAAAAAAAGRVVMKKSTASPLQQEQGVAKTCPNSGFESSSSFESIMGEESAKVGGSPWMKVSSSNNRYIVISHGKTDDDCNTT